ncbi:MAG: hypothetical protein QXY45_03275 [Candidatus Aenigmatarchaeota archaeon]
MIIRIIMENRVYLFFVKLINRIIDYLSNMYTDPKYIAIRTFITMLVPDSTLILCAILSKLHLFNL